MILVFLAAWTVLLGAPDTPVGRLLHRGLVSLPATALSRIGRGQWMIFASVVVILAIGWWVGRDGLAIAALSTPELALMLGSVDLSILADVAIAAVLTWTMARGSALGARWKLGLRRRAGRPSRRARRTRTSRRAPRATNDDDPEPARTCATRVAAA